MDGNWSKIYALLINNNKKEENIYTLFLQFLVSKRLYVKICIYAKLVVKLLLCSKSRLKLDAILTL